MVVAIPKVSNLNLMDFRAARTIGLVTRNWCDARGDPVNGD
jgi:hypothetical protein